MVRSQSDELRALTSVLSEQYPTRSLDVSEATEFLAQLTAIGLTEMGKLANILKSARIEAEADESLQYNDNRRDHYFTAVGMARHALAFSPEFAGLRFKADGGVEIDARR